jgi:uncharacterized phage protein (TIGR02220 family)
LVKESKVNAEQYIVLQGWMISDLKLKGNELIIYACIYGFSQAENQVFSGGLQYLADWTNSTKQSIVKCLKSLVEKGFVVKTDKIINGVKFCEYYATKFNGVCNKVEQGMQQSLTGGMQQSLTNNIDIDNLSNNLINNKEIYKAVIDYLNAKAGTHYKATSKATQQHINARLAEGFKLDDFMRVVDNMCIEWKNSEWEQYLRPSTLFGTKFENYLNRKPQSKGRNGIAVNSAPSDLDGVF